MSHEATRSSSLLRASTVRHRNDTERASHRDVEAVAERHLSRLVTKLGQSVTQHIITRRRVRVAESLLNAQPVECVGVIARPHLSGSRKNAQIDTPATAATRFKRHLRMPTTQLIDDS